MYNPFKPEIPGNIVYYRQPNPGEIRFGHGAIHYREFTRDECQKPDGTLKKWFKSPDDKMRYYRG